MSPITKYPRLPFTLSSDVVGLLCYLCSGDLYYPFTLPYASGGFLQLKINGEKVESFHFYIYLNYFSFHFYLVFIWSACVFSFLKWVFWEQFLKESNINVCICLQKN
jgi:hypothetical protein